MNTTAPSWFMAVDIGNSATACRLAVPLDSRHAVRPVARQAARWLTRDMSDAQALSAHLQPLLAAAATAERLHWLVSSVHRHGERHLAAWVAGQRSGDRYQLLGQQDLPLDVQVEHPHRVGIDRLLAAVAANHLRQSQRAAIVIDAGTAITVDLLNEQGVFLGGAILPGMRMAASALADYADSLPRIDAVREPVRPPAVGKSTEAAIRSGVYWGTLGAVRELVDRLRDQCPAPPEILLTGGDGKKMAEELGRDACFVPDLVLDGIILVGQALASPSA